MPRGLHRRNRKDVNEALQSELDGNVERATLGPGLPRCDHIAAICCAFDISVVRVRRIAQKGGKYLAGGFDKAVGLSRIPPANRYVIVQFENMDKAKAWYEGGQRELERTVASKYADFRVIAVEGAN